MGPERGDGARGPDLERLLRSRAWMAALATVLVLAVAALNAAHVHQIFLARRLDAEWTRVFAHELLVWSTWALAGYPLFALARWMRVRWCNWLYFFAAQIPLSVAVAAGFTSLHSELQQRIVDPQRAPRGEWALSQERWAERPGARRPSPPDGARPFRGPGPERARAFFLARSRVNLAVYWIVLGMGAGVAAFLHARERERVAAELRLRTSRLETELALSQLGSLRDQLRPHFFFNALHTVGGLVQQGKADEAMRVSSALGALLRSTLDYGERQEVALREELAVAHSYLDVERVRLGERLEVAIDAAPDCLDAAVPALLLQPLLENAVRHGIAPRRAGGRIEIRARRAGDEIVLSVRDDGPGFPPEMLAQRADERAGAAGGRRSIGLANARERVRLLHGERQSFTLENDPAGGALVRVAFPFRRAGEAPKESHG